MERHYASLSIHYPSREFRLIETLVDLLVATPATHVLHAARNAKLFNVLLSFDISLTLLYCCQVMEIRSRGADLKKARSVPMPFLYTNLLWWMLMGFLAINVYV